MIFICFNNRLSLYLGVLPHCFFHHHTTMKQSLWIAKFFATTLFCVSLFAFRGQEEDLQRIASAIKQNDVNQILAVSGNQLQVNIFGESNLYSQTQAKFILEAFFRNNPGNQFTFRETWNGATGAFAIGLYQSRQQNIQVYLRTQRVNNRTQLKEIRFSQSANRR